MFKTLLLREVTAGLKRPMLYIFLLVFTVITAASVANGNLVLGGAGVDVYKNAPYILSTYSAFLSILGLLVATTYFNNAALRDYHHRFNEILFSTRLTHNAYLFGRFLGALTLTLIPLLGIFLGFLIGTKIGVNAESFAENSVGELHLAAFINNFLLFLLPNMFIAGTITFTLANQWRSTIISFIAAFVIVMGYLTSGILLTDLASEPIAAMVDVFGVRAFQIDTKYFTGFEKNSTLVGFSGWLLVNRLMWVGIGSILLTISFLTFSTKMRDVKLQKKKKIPNDSTPQYIPLPHLKVRFNFNTTITQLGSFIKINCLGILRSNPFKVMLLFGAGALLSNLINGFEYYGLQSYPVTYKILPLIRGISTVMGMIMLVFYSGELTWKNRVNKIHEVVDATPHYSITFLISKVISLISMAVVFHAILVVVAMIYQLLTGYLKLEPFLYFKDFLYAGLPLYVIWSSLLIFIQTLTNHQYLGYLISIILLFLTELIVEAMDISSYLINIGISPPTNYSDMNGFGAGLEATQWYNFYWLIFGTIALMTAMLLQIRGTSQGFKNRVRLIRLRWSRAYGLTFGLLVIFFLSTGSFVFYNTEILNAYHTSKEMKEERLLYEKHYKVYEHRTQPKIVDVQYNIDIFPGDRRVQARSVLKMVNQSDHTIDSLHFTLVNEVRDATKAFAQWEKVLKIPQSQLLSEGYLGYQTHLLETPLKPGDTIEIEAFASYHGNGFENKVSNLRVAENGTFIDFQSILPGLGYLERNELADPNDRAKHGLPSKMAFPTLASPCGAPCEKNYVSGNASDWVKGETIISTRSDQLAIAPGSLINSWSEDGRKYFHYRTDQVSLNYFSFMSARYEVVRKNWNGVSIEVYYDKKHTYNIDMMVDAVERSLQYFTENFGPYPHRQARIIEFPGYFLFAEAFPGTMPYSESYGFITNLEDEQDNNIIDAVIAHEMAHQWWAHQVVGAHMQGATMLSESLAEYSALMVMKNALNNDLAMKEFLKYDIDNYLRGRGTARQQEMPLISVQDQGYIHYGKGSVILYALQDYIGEDRVNKALRDFLTRFKYKKPYPTSLDFINILEKQIPDSLNYLITDWFQEITLYDYKVSKASAKLTGDHRYQVTMDIASHKVQVDSAGREIETPLHDWVDIGVFADLEEKDLRYCEKIYIDNTKMSFEFEIDFKPQKVVIDPKRLFIEKVANDNVKVISDRNQQ